MLDAIGLTGVASFPMFNVTKTLGRWADAKANGLKIRPPADPIPHQQIVDAKAQFRSLAEPWADTTTSHGRLMLTVLGGLAEFERDLIRTRIGEGRGRAKARGVKLGRKPKLTVHQQQEAIKRRDVDGEPIRDIARSYNVHNSTISRLPSG